MSVLVANIGINPTTIEPNFSAWTENQNTIGALRPDRNFAYLGSSTSFGIGSIDRIFSQYPQENWPQSFNLANMLRTRRLLHFEHLDFPQNCGKRCGLSG